MDTEEFDMRDTKIAIARPFEGVPQIHLPECIGASPRKPMIVRIPVTGERPITYQVGKLPEGLTLADGVINGSVAEEFTSG